MGKINIKNKVILAPMAGFTDGAFRTIAFSNGADIAISEMVSAQAMKYKDRKTLDLLKIYENEKEVGIQLFGSDPEILAAACKDLEENPSINLIDLNLGCPAPKIFKNGQGSALLADPKKIYELLSAMRKSTTKTLSGKIRLGISDKDNYLQIARAVEEAGADFITVHGRTRDQYYSGQADWQAIGHIKETLSIPVIGNGDISFETDIKALLATYKVDGLMIGRGAVGSPWIFEKAKADLENRPYNYPSLDQRFAIILDHINLACQLKEEKIAIPEMRKHLHSYLKGLCGAAKIKNQINTVKTKDQIIEVLLAYKDQLLTLSQ
ncbi:MAG: tRNA dihydrouridine synthase DusB [Bacillota bacterium]|nr:tRNA dihydrouridine synthase DusB [Bacillota bacterium]